MRQRKQKEEGKFLMWVFEADNALKVLKKKGEDGVLRERSYTKTVPLKRNDYGSFSK